MAPFWVQAEEVVCWPLPHRTVPVNPAASPSPRLDWFVRFAGNLERSKGSKLGLLFDGDSLTEHWTDTGRAVWEKYYSAFRPFNFGISGDRVETVLWRLEQHQAEGTDPSLVVLLIGSNNLGRDTPAQVAEGVAILIGKYKERCPKAHLLLLGILPRGQHSTEWIRSKVIETNQLLSKFDDGKGIIYLDFGSKFLDAEGSIPRELMPDFVHPSVKGYQIWADAIQPVVSQYVSTP